MTRADVDTASAATRVRLTEMLTERAAGSRHVLRDSVRWEPPVMQPGTAGLRITAHALATDLNAAAIRGATAWHGAAEAGAAVHRLDPHATVSVEGGPVFLDRRVRLEVDGYTD